LSQVLEQARQIEERRRAEQAAAQAAAAAAAQARRAAAMPGVANAARGGSAGPAAGVSNPSVFDASYLTYPASFDNHTQPGMPSLLSPTLEPLRPERPAVYARGLHTRATVEQQPVAILGPQAP
jgi:hypothetical protein